MTDFTFDFQMVPAWEAVVRVLLAALFGMLIGLDRDMKKKPIDFRAYMIVAVTSCVITIMAQEVYADFQQSSGTLRLDFMRVVEGVLTGIGFLGAGAIIRGSGNDNRVVGSATGASVWAAGGLGLTLGFGYYSLALIAFVTVAGTLFFLGFVRAMITGNRDKEVGS